MVRIDTLGRGPVRKDALRRGQRQNQSEPDQQPEMQGRRIEPGEHACRALHTVIIGSRRSISLSVRTPMRPRGR